MTDDFKQIYNKFEYLPQISYRIIAYLIDNDDLIFKLLKYSDADAWRTDANHQNLTKYEKGLLVYDGLKPEGDCRIFLDQGQNDAWVQEVCILRISVVEAIPTNYIYGHISILFEVYPHYLVNTLSNYQLRSTTIIQRLIEVLNGVDLGEGIGRLYFDNSKNVRSKAVIMGNAPYKGMGILMCNHAL